MHKSVDFSVGFIFPLRQSLFAETVRPVVRAETLRL